VKNTLLSALAVALLLGTAARARCQDGAANDLKPFVVVSFAGYGELKRDIEYLGTASDNPDIAKSLESILMLMTQQQGLAGLDEERPWGAAAGFGDSGPVGWVFLPVTDLQKLFGALGALIGEPQDAGNDVWQLEKDGRSAYVKQQGDWAFISYAPEMLATLPADPAALLGSLPKEYDVAVRLHIQNIPPPLRDMAIDGIKEQLEEKMRQSASAGETRDQLMRMQIEAMTKAINDSDQFTLGFKIDPQGKRSCLDLGMTALEGSDTARRMKTVDAVESNFAGFLLPGSLFSMHVNEATAEENLDPELALLGNFRAHVMEEIDKDDDFDDEEQRASIKELVGELLDVAEETLKKGRLNLGLAVVGAGPINVALGGFVSDGQRLEQAVKKLADMAPSEDGSPTIKLDVAEQDGVRFHTITFPLPDGQDSAQLQPFLGDRIEITLGFGAECVYAALGPDGIGTIEQVMAKSSDSTPDSTSDSTPTPMHMRLALGQILGIAAKLSGNPLVGTAAQMLEGGRDHVHLLQQPVANGVMYRLEIEEGILKLIGNAAKMAMGGAGNL